MNNNHVPAALRNSFAWFAPASNDCKPVKRGHAQDRKAMADFMREQRARFHTLHGGWTRSEWNHQVSQAALNNLERMTDARKHVQAVKEAQPSWKAERERMEAKALEFERASKPHLWEQS